MKPSVLAMSLVLLSFALETTAQMQQTVYEYVPFVTTSQAKIVQVQTFIWVPLTLVFALLLTMCCLCRMDPDKSQDTLIYAKFIANVDKKTG